MGVDFFINSPNLLLLVKSNLQRDGISKKEKKKKKEI